MKNFICNPTNRRGVYVVEDQCDDLRSTDEALAESKLFKAAPEMLDVLMDLLTALDNNPDLKGPNGEMHLDTFECIRDAKNIIRKAKGE